MGRKIILSVIVLVFLEVAAFSQKNDSVKVRLNHYSLTLGIGWSHYYDNLEYGDKNISQDFAGLSVKFFWEPEHRLSLGLESGYYHLFKVKYQLTNDASAEVNRSVVPFLLLVRMRIVDHFYLGTGMGLAVINNKVSGGNSEILTKTWSLSNYEFSGSYVYPLKRHLNVGGEFKVFNFGNLNDWIYSLQVVCAIKI